MPHAHPNGEGEARRSMRHRGEVEDAPGNDATQYGGWGAGWPEHLADSDLMQASAMPSISPNMLRPSGRPPTTPTHYHHSQTAGGDEEGGGGGGGGNGGNPHAVKFVNSTVEILQSQIRKEEAPKKKRTRTTPEQLRILQKAFTTDPMPNSSARLALAKKLGMNARAVQVWFQNRRAKEKLEAKRAEIGQGRERAGAFQPALGPSSRDAGGYIRSLQPVAKASSVRRDDDGITNGEGGQSMYDLGMMYFGDHALSPYANGFDLGAYNYAIDTLAQSPQLFDELPPEDPVEVETQALRGMMLPFARFQSMPAAAPYSYASSGSGSSSNSSNSSYAQLGPNSLGLIFADAGLAEDGGGSGGVGESASGTPANQQRSNSIDVLGMMGDAATLDAQGKIFSTPASREAFLSAPLGQSIPMPAKQRSLSVPELHGMRGGLPEAFRTDLLAIQEEAATVAVAAAAVAAAAAEPKRRSNAGIPSASLDAYAGMPGIVALDDIQAYLDGMSTGL